MSEMNTNPLVSVIVPVYNAAEYLRQTLDCICNQTLRDIEIICVDDGSTDESLSILSEYAASDPRLFVLQQRNQYAGAARTNGMNHARGKYLIFFDSDDIFFPEMLGKMYARAEEVNADIVTCDYAQAFPNKIVPMPFKTAALRSGVSLKNFCLYTDAPEEIFRITTSAPWNKLFRAEFVRKHAIEWSSAKATNDLEFVCYALVVAERVSHIPEVLMHYCIRENSTCRAAKKDPLLHSLAYKKLKQKLENKGLFDKVRYSWMVRLFGSEAWHATTIAKELLWDYISVWRNTLTDELGVPEATSTFWSLDSKIVNFAVIHRPVCSLIINDLTKLNQTDFELLKSVVDTPIEILVSEQQRGVFEKQMVCNKRHAMQFMPCDFLPDSSETVIFQACHGRARSPRIAFINDVASVKGFVSAFRGILRKTRVLKLKYRLCRMFARNNEAIILKERYMAIKNYCKRLDKSISILNSILLEFQKIAILPLDKQN